MTDPPPHDPAADRLERLELAVHRLEVLIRSKLSPPVEQMTLAHAARLGFPRRTLSRLVAAGVFTDDRAMRRSGAPVRLYADELRVYRTDGEEGVMRLRRELGRD